MQFAKPSHLSLKRLLLVGAALLCSVLSLSAQAQYGGGGGAGGWSVTLTIDSSVGGASMIGVQSITLQSSPASETTPGTHTYEKKAVVTIHAHWNSGGYVPQPPPKVCAVKVAASGQAWGQSLVTGQPVSISGIELNDGFYDTPISFSTDSQQGATESGLHLIQMNGTGADRAKSFNLSAKMTMTNTALAQYFCQIGFSVSSDSRAVTLTRAGAHNETVDSDGTIHGDTTYSYKSTSDSGGTILDPSVPITVAFWNWQQFTADLVGDWSKKNAFPIPGSFQIRDVTYKWNPAYSEANMLWNKWSQKFGTMNFELGSWKGTPDSPNAESLIYTATDNVDGAKADATYILTKHDSVENLVDVLSGYFKDVRLGRQQIIGPRSIGYEDEISQDTGGTWSISGSLPEIAPWFPVFGITYMFQPPPNRNRKVTLLCNLQIGEFAKIYERDSMNRHTQYWRAYDAGGVLLADQSHPEILSSSFYDTRNDYAFFATGPNLSQDGDNGR